MKYGNEYYMELSRHICSREYVDELSIGARMLFVTLNELEQRYCSTKENSCFRDRFFRTDEDLAQDMGVSVTSLRTYKKELKEKAPELVRIGSAHFIDDMGKKSEKKVTTYTILV